jgi:antitoxin YobK
MSIASLNQGFKLIENNSKGFFKGETEEELILKAELFLELKFPKSYRLFLTTKGCGSFMHKEFYGIIDDDFENGSVPDAIWLTWDERKHFMLDKNLLLIAQSQEGYYALDISSMHDNECRVVDWISDLEFNKLEVVAPDFGTFFLSEIMEVLNAK